VRDGEQLAGEVGDEQLELEVLGAQQLGGGAVLAPQPGDAALEFLAAGGSDGERD
jgi:hypothetical protein